MSEYRIEPAKPEHAIALAATMRAADRAEVEAQGSTAEEALLGSLGASREAFTAYADDEIICMFGIATPTLLSMVGVPWLLTAESLPRHSREFLMQSRRVVREWSSQHGLLVNYVDARYDQALRWLARLGFSVGQVEYFGPDRAPIRRVELRS